MTHDTHESQLLARIGRLEQGARRSRNRGLLGLVVGAALLVSSAQRADRTPDRAAVADVVAARRIELVNADGQVVMLAGVDEAGNGQIELADGRGQVLFAVGADDFASGAMRLYNAEGRRTVFVGNSPAGDGGVLTNDREGHQRFYMGEDVSGNGVVGTEGGAWRVR